MRDWDIERSEGHAVMVWIQVLTLPDAKAGPRLIGLLLQESLKNPYEEKQMIAKVIPAASASSARINQWDAIDWPTIEKQVRRLQMRIAKAERERRHGKVKALQWLLTHSFYGKLLAVRRVSRNKGCKTPGVDRVVMSTPKQKMKMVDALKKRGYKPSPLKRIYIPKKNGKRPLGIPTVKDRCMQSLYLLALEPVAETNADKHSYGFRPKRSTADAITQCHTILAGKNRAKWILEGDIRSCFDKISHEWLMKHIPMDKQILGKWLKAGYMENQVLYATEEGTPQVRCRRTMEAALAV